MPRSRPGAARPCRRRSRAASRPSALRDARNACCAAIPWPPSSIASASTTRARSNACSADATGRSSSGNSCRAARCRPRPATIGELLALRYFASAASLARGHAQRRRPSPRAARAGRDAATGVQDRDDPFIALRRDRRRRHSRRGGHADRAHLRHRHRLPQRPAPGDRFSVVYEMLYESGELVAPGRILAARFVNDGRTYDAVLFHDDEGNDAYYSLDGSSRAQGLPALAGRVLAHQLRLRRALPPDLQQLARAHRRGFRRAQGHARARGRRRHGGLGGRARRLRQRDRAAPRRRHHDALRPPLALRLGHARRARACTQGEVIGYVGHDRLGDGPAPALRIPRRRRSTRIR